MLFYNPKSSSPCVHAWYVHGLVLRAWVLGGVGGWYVHGLVVCAWVLEGGGTCMGPRGGG